MGAPADKNTSGNQRFARVRKLLILRIALPIAVSAIAALVFIFGFGWSLYDMFMPVLIGVTPIVASCACGASFFGHDLYANGWRKMLLPLLGFLTLLALMYLPFLTFDFARARYMLQVLCGTFACAAFMTWLAALHGALMGTTVYPPPWMHRRF